MTDLFRGGDLDECHVASCPFGIKHFWCSPAGCPAADVQRRMGAIYATGGPYGTVERFVTRLPHGWDTRGR